MTKKEITQLSYEITGCAIKVHKTLGPGLLESIYEQCPAYELRKKGFKVERQKPVTIVYDEIEFDSLLKLDLLVEGKIVVELKTVENILPIHEAHLMTYMKILKAPQGLLINFNTLNITKTIKPLINSYFTQLD